MPEVRAGFSYHCMFEECLSRGRRVGHGGMVVGGTIKIMLWVWDGSFPNSDSFVGTVATWFILRVLVRRANIRVVSLTVSSTSAVPLGLSAAYGYVTC
jgi:hypothetical protein